MEIFGQFMFDLIELCRNYEGSVQLATNGGLTMAYYENVSFWIFQDSVLRLSY